MLNEFRFSLALNPTGARRAQRLLPRACSAAIVLGLNESKATRLAGRALLAVAGIISLQRRRRRRTFRIMEIPDQLIDAVKVARHVMVLTGAGTSAESGLPTFRDPLTGLWERFNPGELATPRAFERDPALVWGWYEWRRMKALQAFPNAAHRAIQSLQEKVTRMTLVTQNVDDPHERAGSSNVQYLYGTLAYPYCTGCQEPFAFPQGVPEEPPEGRRVDPPRCALCGARIRPGVVWFGEALPQREWELAERAAEDCDVFACVGTSSVVYPAASLIERAAARGAVTIQINPNGTDWDTRVSYDLRGPAGVVLPDLVRRV